MNRRNVLALATALCLSACDSPPVGPEQPNFCAPDTKASAACRPFTGSLASCKCSVDDYSPRFNNSQNDTWPACISDAYSGKYVPVGTSTSAAGRTLAFDQMGALLWKKGSIPTSADFTSARDLYATSQGIGSRVARRQDIHYPEVPGNDKFACSTEAVAIQYPDRCAGPGRLKPIIDAAFVDGIANNKPWVQAARIEAALLWFSYLSTLSEQWTSSFDNLADVDSSCGYFMGGTERSKPTGLGKYIQQLDAETYDRAFDGILAARCFRDLDKALPSTCTLFYDRAIQQTDKALIRGMALILRDRMARVLVVAGGQQQAEMQFVNVLGLLLDRAARAIDSTRADTLKIITQATTVNGMNVSQGQAQIDALFSCP